MTENRNNHVQARKILQILFFLITAIYYFVDYLNVKVNDKVNCFSDFVKNILQYVNLTMVKKWPNYFVKISKI